MLRHTAFSAADSMHLGSTSSFSVLQDFKMVAKMPALVALGAALQYTIMPTMGYTISRVAQLPSAFAVGYELHAVLYVVG